MPSETALPARSPSWSQVEEVLVELVRAKVTFATGTSASNTISAYEPGRRIMLETDNGPAWVDIASIRECWETFERLGRVCREDVLEPGRRSAFMLALFERVAGVVREPGEKTYLAMPAAAPAPRGAALADPPRVR